MSLYDERKIINQCQFRKIFKLHFKQFYTVSMSEYIHIILQDVCHETKFININNSSLISNVAVY